MSKVESIERDIEKLGEAELADLRHWFAAFGAETWDHQFEEDARVGRLDHTAGKSTRP